MRHFGVPTYAIIAAVLSFMIVAGALRNSALLHVPKSLWADLRTAAATPSFSPVDDIALVVISEQTLQGFAYRSPIDRAFMATLIQGLLDQGAKQVIVDLLFDQSTVSGKDQQLEMVLNKNASRVVIAAPAKGRSQLYFSSPQTLTLAQPNLVKDSFDGAVRWIFMGQPNTPSIAVLASGVAAPSDATLTALIYPPTLEGLYALFPTFEAHTVAQLPTAWFRGKTIFIGAALDQADRHRTPYSSLFGVDNDVPGIFLHALATHQLKQGRRVSEISQPLAMLFIFVMAAGGVWFSLWHQGPTLKGMAAAALGLALISIDFLLWNSSFIALPSVAMGLAFVVSFMISSSILYWLFREKKRFLHHAFAQYAPQAIVNELLRNPEKLRLNGEQREVTMLFTDLQGFTALTEVVGSAELVPILNAYMDGIIEPILHHGGTVDRLVGDAVIAIFNAPLDLNDHHCAAVSAALEIDAFCKAYARSICALGHPFGRTRIGINSGPVIIGNFGGRHRFQYTAHGDTVNIAARLESLSKHLGTSLLVGEQTAKACPAQTFRLVGRFVLVGKEKPLCVYEPVEDTERLVAYQRAYEALAGEDPETQKKLANYLDLWPNDSVANFHLERIKNGASNDIVIMDKK